MHKLRNDLILIGCLALILGIGFVILFTQFSKKDNLIVEIYCENQLFTTTKLDQDQEIKVKNVVVQIKNQEVFILYSPCKDQICVHQGKIHLAGQTITCLPEQVYVRIEGKGVDVGV